MPYQLCTFCLTGGYCRRLHTQIVSDVDLANPDFIRDLRAFAFRLGINDEDWQEYLTNLYRDYPGWIADANDHETFLDMEEFERPFIREWFRGFCCTPCPPDVQPRVRPEARERVRILATILKAHDPVPAMMWGVSPANDNDPG